MKNPHTSPTTYSDEELFVQLDASIELYADERAVIDPLQAIIDEIKQRMFHYKHHQSKRDIDCDICWLGTGLTGEERKAVYEDIYGECDHCEPPGYFK